MLIHIDHDKCWPCGVCEGIFPKAFKMAHVIEVNTSEAMKDYERFLVCQEACPYSAIYVEAT